MKLAMVGDWVGFWWWERKLCEREKWKRNVGEREGICRERGRKLWIQDWFSVYGSKWFAYKIIKVMS